ncbi:MAG: rRNA maturation RNase YbeY [Myxococcales bacterium]|nr:rRNA maturation RNase YbeY [Myxococcales bacterium]
MPVILRCTARLPSRARQGVRRDALRLLRALRLEGAELSLWLLGDRRMTQLNRRWRGRARTTDVLSFAQREGPRPRLHPEILGDVAICLPQARRQARARGATLQDELRVLLAHGLLHLLGYEHEDRPLREQRRMWRRQEALVRQLHRAGRS